MLNFTFSNTTKIVFGRGVEEQAGKEAAKWGKKVMLHYGGDILSAAVSRSGGKVLAGSRP